MEQSSSSPKLFEISINAEKFSQFTTTLNSIISSHEKTLQTHTRELNQIRMALEDKVGRIKGELEYEVDKI